VFRLLFQKVDEQVLFSPLSEKVHTMLQEVQTAEQEEILDRHSDYHRVYGEQSYDAPFTFM
jgi:hypothetical protein